MITFLTITCFILTGLVITGSVVVRNLLIQNDSLKEINEQIINKLDKTEQETIKYYKYFLELFSQTYSELQRVDKRGSFSSDDEVGFAFKVIALAIEGVKQKLTALNIEEGGDSEKRTG